MSYESLTDNQKAGIAYQAAHNCKPIEEYIQMRLEQDADRGYRELVQSGLANITTKLVSEPSILAEVEAAVDEQVAAVVADREAKAEEARIAAELAAQNQEPPEEPQP